MARIAPVKSHVSDLERTVSQGFFAASVVCIAVCAALGIGSTSHSISHYVAHKLRFGCLMAGVAGVGYAASGVVVGGHTQSVAQWIRDKRELSQPPLKDSVDDNDALSPVQKSVVIQVERGQKPDLPPQSKVRPTDPVTNQGL